MKTVYTPFKLPLPDRCAQKKTDNENAPNKNTNADEEKTEKFCGICQRGDGARVQKEKNDSTSKRDEPNKIGQHVVCS